jgi:Zn-finger nucleic acid-binding protein
MSERSGVEIDYCPECRGVWLDRGELDKIIEKSAAQPTPVRRVDNYNEAPRVSYDEHGHDDHSSQSNHGFFDERQGLKKRKKEGFLGELFDF